MPYLPSEDAAELRRALASQMARIAELEAELAPFRDTTKGIGGYIDSVVNARLDAEEHVAILRQALERVKREAVVGVTNASFWDEVNAALAATSNCEKKPALWLSLKPCGDIWLHVNAPSGLKASVNLGLGDPHSIVRRALTESARKEAT